MKCTKSNAIYVKATIGAVLMLALSFASCSKETATVKVEEKPAFDTSSSIAVISREDGSGTRGAFIELTGVEKKDSSGKKVDYTTEEAMITNSTSVMMTTVAGDKNAIGYVSLGYLNDTVKALKIDSAEASVKAIQAGSYKVVRPFNIVTGENCGNVTSENAKDFIAFILSSDGQKIVANNGFIPLTGGAAYETAKIEVNKVVVAGSSSVTPLMEKLKEAYLLVQPTADIEIQQSDSTTGVTSTLNGICSIGMASRDLKAAELEKGLTPIVIARDGIAIVVNKVNPLSEVTKEQVRKIYTGEITTWNEIEK